LHFGKCRNVYVLPHRDDAAAEAQRGLVTSLESDAKEVEGLQKPRGFLLRVPLLWKPPPARWSNTKSHIHHRASGEYQGFSFLRTKIVCVDDGRWGKLFFISLTPHPSPNGDTFSHWRRQTKPFATKCSSCTSCKPKKMGDLCRGDLSRNCNLYTLRLCRQEWGILKGERIRRDD
jgi:hypothetical protein